MDASMERLLLELAETVRQRYYGKYRGIVTDNDDPQNMGRLRANVPDVLGTEVSPWALPCTTYAGQGSGQYTVPPVGAGVWIEFEAGDPSSPVWTGCWWQPGQIPRNETGAEANPDTKTLRTEQGLLVSMDDAGQTISVSDADGNNLLRLEVQSGQVLLKGNTKVVVEAPQIELVDRARHPLVFGDDLLQYLTQLVTALQTHTHPGELAAGVFPVTPMVPAVPFPMPQASLLSTKVKTG